MKQAEIKELVEYESKKLYRLRPRLKKVAVSYEKESDGFFTTKLFAHTANNDFQLSRTTKCLRSGIKEVFKRLKRKTSKEKTKQKSYITPNFKEAI